MKPIYAVLSDVKFLSKNYALKFLFIAFLGIHIPLIGVIAVISSGRESNLMIISVALSCTLVACFLTLFILKGLLEPLHYSILALNKYLYKQELPHLPLQYQDEAGRLMQKIQITIQRLDSLLKEKDELAALLSHDVRVPLANISSLSNLILQESDITEIHFYTTKIAELADEQLQFVQSILSKMRATESEAASFHLKTVRVRHLFEKVIHTLATQLENKNLTIQNDIDPELVISLEEQQISHVLLNLLTNAVKFSYPDSTIRVLADTDSEFVNIHVKDQGMGFSKEEGHNLFKIYTPFSRKGTSGEPSTGMGLYLAKKLMEKHGGDIKAASTGPGEGAVFTISFPLSDDYQS